jgi:parallel beta-helix repeat protein
MKNKHAARPEQPHSKAIHNTLILGLFMAAGLLLAHPAQAANKSTRISSVPYTIEEPGSYVLTEDLECAGTAIEILASQVDLNLGGYTLTGNGSGYGVHVQRQTDVRIHQGTVQGFENGVLFEGAFNSSLDNVTATENNWGIAGRANSIGLTLTHNRANHNYGTGIMFDSWSRGITVAHNTANQNGGIGLLVAGGAFAVSLTGNTANGNGWAGIDLGSTSANDVTDNTANYNGERGIILEGASNNTVTRNTTELNILGISLEWGANGNTLKGNKAGDNRDADLLDNNPAGPSCLNTWINNTFESPGGAAADCIQ